MRWKILNDWYYRLIDNRFLYQYTCNQFLYICCIINKINFLYWWNICFIEKTLWKIYIYDCIILCSIKALFTFLCRTLIFLSLMSTWSLRSPSSFPILFLSCVAWRAAFVFFSISLFFSSSLPLNSSTLSRC